MACVLIMMWHKGEELQQDQVMGVLSLVFLIFFSYIQIMYFSAANIDSFFGILERYSSIFEMQDYTRKRVSKLTSGEQPEVTLKDCAFTWGFQMSEKQAMTDWKKAELNHTEAPVLKNVSFGLQPGEHMVVVGKVGCGKTSLLLSLMEETVQKEGRMTIKGSVAYVEQEPFIISGTIKENIVMGLKFDAERFSKATIASQLQSDLMGFKKGANTVIGERGINISGWIKGQDKPCSCCLL